MISEGFDALLTFDKNLQYQQNFSKYTITVFVFNAPSNTYEILNKLSPQVVELLNKGELPLGAVVIK